MNNSYKCNSTHNNSNVLSDDYVKETIEKIIHIQKIAVREEVEEKMCDADFLGEGRRKETECNTRPIQVFTHEDKPWYCSIERDGDGCVQETNDTCIFRAEKVVDGTVTLRALVRLDEEEATCHKYEKYKATDSFIIIKLVDIAALRCLKDAFVDICIRNSEI